MTHKQAAEACLAKLDDTTSTIDRSELLARAQVHALLYVGQRGGMPWADPMPFEDVKVPWTVNERPK